MPGFKVKRTLIARVLVGPFREEEMSEMAKRKSAAPMNKGRATSGGGITSNKRVEKPVVYGNRHKDALDPGPVDQIGQALGYRGDPFMPGKPVREPTD